MFSLPVGSFDINRGSAQANGLVFWAPLLNNSTREFLTGKALSRSVATLARVATERGLLFDFTSSEYILSGRPQITGYPLTVMCWFNTDATTDNDVLMAIGSSATADAFTLSAQGGAAGDPIRAYSEVAAGSSAGSTSTGYTAGSWYHAVGVFSGDSSRAAYLNGGSKGSNSTSRAVTFSALNTLRIAAGAAAAAANFFDGRIMDARVYNRALTDAEVLTYYQNPWDLYLPVHRWWMQPSFLADLFVTPTTASAVSSVTAPVVVLSSLTLTPSAASAVSSALFGAVSANLTLAPTPASATAQARLGQAVSGAGRGLTLYPRSLDLTLYTRSRSFTLGDR